MATAGRPGRAGVRRRHRLGLARRVGRRGFTCQRIDILLDRPARSLLRRPGNVRAFDPLVTAGVGLDDRGVDGEPLAADQTGRHAAADDLFEHAAQDIAVAEPAVAVDRERRVVGNAVLQPQPAEPAIGQVELDLLAQPPFRADRIAVADQQHPDHQLRIDRRTAHAAVVRDQLLTQPAQVEYRVDLAQKVIGGNNFVQIELIEQAVLPPNRITHHRADLVA